MMKSEKVKYSSTLFLSTISICLILFIAPLKINAQVQAENKMESPQKPEDISPLLIGESIPMVVLKDASRMDFDLNKAVSEKPTILIFYRGGWCPFCNKQLSGLQDIAPELEKTGYQLLAISTDAPEGLMQSESKEHLSYKLFSDADLNVSKQFGIAYKAPKGYWEMLPKTTGGMDKELLIPVPSVFILNKKGIIQFEYINPDFKQRISPDLLKAVAYTIYKIYKMKILNASYLKVAFLSLALILAPVGGSVFAQKKEKAKTMVSEGISFTEGKWLDVLAKAKSSNKYIFVDAYAVWCGPCKLLKSKTFKEQQAALYFNDNFINYTVDTDKGEGTTLAEKWDITTYPTLLFFSPEGKLLLKQVGFVNGDKLIELGKQAKSKK